MSEAKHRASTLELFKKQHPLSVVFRFEDMFRAGIPDSSIAWKRVVSYWEFKYASPTVKWRGAQSAEMRRLWSTGIPAYYVIFLNTREGRRTLIQPATADYKNLQTPHFVVDFDYWFIVKFIERVHLGGLTNDHVGS